MQDEFTDHCEQLVVVVEEASGRFNLLLKVLDLLGHFGIAVIAGVVPDIGSDAIAQQSGQCGCVAHDLASLVAWRAARASTFANASSGVSLGLASSQLQAFR